MPLSLTDADLDAIRQVVAEEISRNNAALVETVAQAGATFRTTEGHTLDGAAVLRLVEAARSQGGLVL